MTRQPARVAVAVRALFLVFGVELGTWVVSIPTIRLAVGFGLHTLGLLLLLLAAGSLVGMYGSGSVMRRLGPETVVTIGATATSVAVLGPAFSGSVISLASCLVVLGLCLGLLDASMNAQAVEVERAAGRPMINGFHAWASGGGMVASGLAVLTHSLGMSNGQLFLVSSTVGLVVAALGCRELLRARPPRATPMTATPVNRSSRAHAPRWTWRTVLLGSAGFALLLAEGVANDWSAVHLRVALGASVTTGAYAFGAFSVSMLAMRLLADSLVVRIGARRFCRLGCVVAGVGVTVAAITTNPEVAVAAWGVFGLGLAGCAPLVFSAAGSLYPGETALGVSRAVSLGYVGLLAGPSLIGFLAPLVGLRGALAVPGLCCVYAALVAGRALTRDAHDRPQGREITRSAGPNRPPSAPVPRSSTRG